MCYVSTVDTWSTVNIWTKNVTEVPNKFLALTNSDTTDETNENSGAKFKKT
jgi:hypothetical protein